MEGGGQFAGFDSKVTRSRSDLAQRCDGKKPAWAQPLDDRIVERHITKHVAHDKIHGVTRRQAVVEIVGGEAASAADTVLGGEFVGGRNGHRRNVIPGDPNPVRSEPNRCCAGATCNLERVPNTCKLLSDQYEVLWQRRGNRTICSLAILLVPAGAISCRHR